LFLGERRVCVIFEVESNEMLVFESSFAVELLRSFVLRGKNLWEETFEAKLQ